MSANVNDTDINVTGLTAGVQYSFTVIAVAGDDTTQSEMAQISHYTSKMMSYIFAHESIYSLFSHPLSDSTMEGGGNIYNTKTNDG